MRKQRSGRAGRFVWALAVWSLFDFDAREAALKISRGLSPAVGACLRSRVGAFKLERKLAGPCGELGEGAA